MRLSPNITPARYKRPSGKADRPIKAEKYTFDDIDVDKAKGLQRVSRLGDNMIVYYGESGEVYVGRGHVHVGGAFYDSNKMVFIREMVLDALSHLSDENVVLGLRRISESRIDPEAE